MSGMGTTPPSTENSVNQSSNILNQKNLPVQPLTITTSTSSLVPPSPTSLQVYNLLFYFIVFYLFFVRINWIGNFFTATKQLFVTISASKFATKTAAVSDSSLLAFI